MGYTTNFTGRFTLDQPLAEAHAAYLRALAGTRRMKRVACMTAELPDELREAVGLPVGVDGEYFVGSHDDGEYGQSRTGDIAGYNDEPGGQPSLWCQWTPTEDDTGLEWDGGEKFYYYVEWLEYIVEHFLKPWGYKLDGQVSWQGEEDSDTGVILALDNKIVSGTSALELLASTTQDD
jgi:hypothetical protein